MFVRAAGRAGAVLTPVCCCAAAGAGGARRRAKGGCAYKQSPGNRTCSSPIIGREVDGRA